MERTSQGAGGVVEPWKRLARRLLAIARNRLELLLCEMQEERERLLRVLLLALGVAVFGLLSAMALSVVIVAVLWDVSRVGALLGVAALHGGVAVLLYQRLAATLHDWESLPSTLGQLRKDRALIDGDQP